MKKPTSFFKVFIDEIDYLDLKIPIAFTQSMEQALPKKVYLRDRCNKMWTIKVSQLVDAWYFLDGWAKFVDDNLVTSGDILIFEYFWNSLFNVKIYGPSAIEKEIEGPYKFQGVKHKHEDDCDADDDEKTVSEDFNYILKRREGDNFEGDDNDGDKEDEETEDGNYVLVTHPENRHQVRHEERVNAEAGSTRKTIKRQVSCYGMEIFRAGLAQLPRNPYFVAKIMQKRKADLFIPRDVIKDNNLELMGREMSLLDPHGREFRAKCKKWKDGRIIVSGGWRNLCRLNFVEEEDRCICEFIQFGDRTLLSVSFVRVDRH